MEHNGLSYDAAANLMLAYRTLCDLEKVAHENNLPSVSMITEEGCGKVPFFLSGVNCGMNYCVTHIETEDASIFAQKIEVFRAYWENIMAKEKESNATRIAELKAELAKLEGRA